MPNLIHATLNDLFQRIITFNKWEQRRNLANYLSELKTDSTKTILDFGCGTALFAPIFLKNRWSYFGYDIDEGLIQYAAKLYPKGEFTTDFSSIKTRGPFDLVLVNCCSHHISDQEFSALLRQIRELLRDSGHLLFIDILKAEGKVGYIRSQFLKLEKGQFVRSMLHYKSLIESQFSIVTSHVERSHVFSLKGNPAYNDLAVFTCRPLPKQ